MKDTGKSNKLQSAAELKPAEKVDRKPYATPRLKKLGHVTDLTQGGGSVFDDGEGGGEAEP